MLEDNNKAALYNDMDYVNVPHDDSSVNGKIL